MKWLADENFDNKIIRGILLRQPAFDILRVQDQPDLQGSPDGEVLSWASDRGRIVLTRDVTTLIADAYERIRMGLDMPGVGVIRRHAAISQIIDDLLLIDEFGDPTEWTHQVRFLPLP